jgi:hypothetical protein
MKNLSRATALKIAAVLSFLMNALSVMGTLPFLAQGAAVANQGTNSPPYAVLLIALLTGVVGIVAAFGAWKQQRWGIVLTILANMINGLSALPGIFFAPLPALMAAAIMTVVVTILIIVLCLWRERKPAAMAG